ncbi:hypothetical protein DFH07DRAFT_820113 [Mycena maculata]|uniref:FACT complex subunit SPT16 N-terminal lobe domain-containing protein n=1 Tax=Mycena maculata TaxID=230809 RepID=A0AAD7NEU2_9AGAR|nr:hypothetical protein DFH07DRAFT_820113 [Mycena maculata]
MHALFLVAGDPAPQDEPTGMGTRIQVVRSSLARSNCAFTFKIRYPLLGYEFRSTLILFAEQNMTILSSASKAKILSQIADSRGDPGTRMVE